MDKLLGKHSISDDEAYKILMGLDGFDLASELKKFRLEELIRDLRESAPDGEREELILDELLRRIVECQSEQNDGKYRVEVDDLKAVLSLFQTDPDNLPAIDTEMLRDHLRNPVSQEELVRLKRVVKSEIVSTFHLDDRRHRERITDLVSLLAEITKRIS